MKKLSLTVIACFIKLASLFAQSPATITDSSAYVPRKLHLDEIDLVSSYYWQDGNHSAVTGGIGTESLTDFANTIDIKLLARDKKDRINSLLFEAGIDNYSSASSDKIDPSTISSASSGDTRIYPSLSWTRTDEAKGYSIGAVASFSTEYDYKSFGIGINASKLSKDKNREFAVKLQAYFDTWKVLYPIELRSGPDKEHDEGSSPRNSYSASFTYSQVVNKRLQIALLLDIVQQQGLLATKYQRVYFTDNSVHTENLPDSRFKLPIGIRVNYFLGDRFILRAYYRYYMDNWGLTAHTASLEVPVKINPFLSIAPTYRYYTQSAADQFAPFGTHTAAEAFYTSDFDLSQFNSHFLGANFRITPEKGIFGFKHFTMLELRYGHYMRSDGLHSDIITLNLKYK